MDNSTYHRCAFCDKVLKLNDDVWQDRYVRMFCSELHAMAYYRIEYIGTLRQVVEPAIVDRSLEPDK